MRKSKKIRCPGCRRVKAKKHFVPKSGVNAGKRFLFGFCRHCSQTTHAKHGEWNPKLVARIKRNCPEYVERVRKDVREEMRRKRLEKDPSYHQGIVRANKVRQVKAIEKLHGIQGNYCAMESEGECNYGKQAPNIDHKHEDGRKSRSRDTYMVAAEVLRMEHPEEKFQLLCIRHNVQKYSSVPLISSRTT